MKVILDFVLCTAHTMALHHLHVHCLQYEICAEGPGPFYHLMDAADVYLCHTHHIVLQKIVPCWISTKLEETETGHTRTIDHNNRQY